MLRKLSLAAVAAVALGGAALAPTSASAWRLASRLARRLARGWWGPRFYVGAPGLLRLRRLLCPPAGPDALGTPLAAGQPLLLSAIRSRSVAKAPASAGAFCGHSPSNFMQFFRQTIAQCGPETIAARPNTIGGP